MRPSIPPSGPRITIVIDLVKVGVVVLTLLAIISQPATIGNFILAILDRLR